MSSDEILRAAGRLIAGGVSAEPLLAMLPPEHRFQSPFRITDMDLKELQTIMVQSWVSLDVNGLQIRNHTNEPVMIRVSKL